MVVPRGAHGHQWGDFFCRSAGMTEGAPKRLMAAYLTWRAIPLPRRLVPVARRAHQPPVPSRQPGTYGNAAVARMTAGGARHHTSSTSNRRVATITNQPRPRTTAATTATTARAPAPSGTGAPGNPTTSTPPSPPTSTPHATAHSPHRPQTTEATRTTGSPAPSGAGTPQSPRQERAAKKATQRHPPQHHAATATREHQASPARRGNMPSHMNTTTTSARPEQPLGTMRPQTGPGPGPACDPGPQPQTPPDASTRGQRPAAPTQANPEPHPHHSPPVQTTASPTHKPSDGPPTQTGTATPTDDTSAQPERPLGPMRPHAQIPTESPSPQAPAVACTSTAGYHPPARAQAEQAPHQHHDPPAGPAVRPTKAPSGSPPAPSPELDPDPVHAGVPADAPRANTPGHELPTGVAHPEGGTPAARPAAAEASGSTRALAGHMGGLRGQYPCQMAQTRVATPIGRRGRATRTARPAMTRGAHGGRKGGSRGTPAAERSTAANGGPKRPGTTQGGDT